MSDLKTAETEKRSKLQKEKPHVYEKVMRFADKVKRGESIAILQFQYDYTCNFQCEHCAVKRFQGKKNVRFFTLDDVRELSRQADELGLANIVITGGEPLVFKDFDKLVEAIDPQKFYITSDSNGWFLDDAKARHLKEIGVDKIQLSLDSLNAREHDDFRHHAGSHARAVRAIDACLNAGLNIILSTVVTHQRIKTDEFIEFLEFAKSKGVGTFVTYGKPVGCWQGNFDMLVTADDMKYMRDVLEKKYDVFTHLTPSYGMNLGCIAVKRMVSVTKYGDIMPCPYMHVSLGNFFKEPLKDILARGMKNKWFGRHVDTCLAAQSRSFIDKYIVPTYDRELPVPYDDIFTDDDLIK